MSEYKSCLEACIDLDVSCPNTECRNWINYEKDLNCVYHAIDKAKDNNIKFSLRDVAERLNCSFVRVKQLEESGLKKLYATPLVDKLNM